MFELLRKFALFTLLFVVAMGSYLTAQNSTDWQEPLWVQMYPISGDGREATSKYITQLKEKDFLAIEKFMQREAERYQVEIGRPVKVILGAELDELPPAFPDDPGPLGVGLWSLKVRWWANDITSEQPGPQPDIRMFLVYFDPEQTPMLEHSVGLQKGLLGVVNVFAKRAQTQTNNFVIAHEMLHTLGASDKYALGSNLPAYPDGYAEPDKQPLHPQTRAELMGGRIPVSNSEAVIPRSLSQAVVGAGTAEEIRWLE